MPPACSRMLGRGIAAFVICAAPIAVSAQTTIHVADQHSLAIAIISANPGDTIVFGNDIFTATGSTTPVVAHLGPYWSGLAPFDEAGSQVDGTGQTLTAPSQIASALMIPDGATLDITGSDSYSDHLLLGGLSTIRVIPSATAIWTGAIADAGPLAHGTLNVAGGGSLAITNSSNSYSGGTVVGANSTVSIAADGALGSHDAGVTLGDSSSPGTLAITTEGRVDSARSFTFGPAGGVISTGPTTNAELSGAIEGTGGFTKAGGGTLTLTGTNSYAGLTNVIDGTLVTASRAALGSTPSVAIGPSGTLDLHGYDLSTAALTGSGNILLNGAATLTIGSNNGNSAFGGTIAGNGGIVKVGAGTLFLSGSNTYSGRTSIDAGRLSISNDASLGASDNVVMATGATLAMTASGTYTRPVTLGTMSTLEVSPDQTAIWVGSIRDPDATPNTIGATNLSGTLGITGGGTLVLNGNNSYSGGTVVTGNSTVSIASDIALGATASALNLGDARSSGTLAVITNGALFSSRPLVLGAGGGIVETSPTTLVSLSGTLSGAGGLRKSGTGTLVLSGRNTYSGGTVVEVGTLVISSDENLGGTGITTASEIVGGAARSDRNPGGFIGRVVLGSTSAPATLAITPGTAFSSSRPFWLAAGGGTIDTIGSTAASLTGTIAGAGGLIKAGSGSLTVSGANVYAGETTVNAGTLIAGRSSVFGSSPSLNIGSAATVDFGGFSQSLNTVSGTGNLVLSRGALMTVGATNGDSIFGGTITGTGGITKIGSGTLTLSSPNTFSGGITVSAGTVSVGADAHLGGAGAVSLGDSTTLALTTSGTFGHSLQLAGRPLINIGSNAVTWTGLVSDGVSSGALQLTTGGTLTLANNANSYSGGTIITGGTTVVVGADGALGAQASGVTLGDRTSSATLAINASSLFTSSRPVTLGAYGGTIETIGGSTATWYGAISGSGGLTKAGAGVLTLSGANTYSGSTSVTSGTLRAGRQDAFGTSGVLTVANGAVFDLAGFNQSLRSLAGAGVVALGGPAVLTLDIGSSAVLFPGTLTGSGALVKAGAGTLALTGTNSYSGGTIVRGGTLAGNTASLQGNIVNTARVVFDQAANGTYAGSMTGTGVLEKSGAGMLTLSGTNSYMGGTLVSAGTLIGDPSSLQGTIVNNGVLVFDHEGSGRFAGTISGPGAIEKRGGGTLAIDGAHPFSGTMSVQDGTVALNAGLAGHVSVAEGAALRGAGWVGGSLSLAGTLLVEAPGTAAASYNARRLNLEPAQAALAPSLVIDGNLTATPGSNLQLTLTPNGAPPVVVNGLASLAGTRVTVGVNDPNPARYATYIGLTSSGLSVEDIHASSTTPGIVPVLKYGPQSMYLTLLNENIPLRGIATSPAAAAVADALDALKPGMAGDLAFVVRELTALDNQSLNVALRQLSGELHSTEWRLTADESVLVTDLVRAAIDDRDNEDDSKRRLTGPTTLRWWFQLTGQRSRFTPAVYESAIADGGGGGGGFDFRAFKRIVIGGGGSFSRAGLSMQGFGGSSHMQAPRAFGYAGYNAGPFFFNGGASTSRTTYVTRRPVVFTATVPTASGDEPLSGGIDRVADSAQTGITRDTWTEWKDRMKYGTWTYEWKLGYRSATYERDPFKETGAGSISLTGFGRVLKTKEADLTAHFFRRSGAWRPRVFVSYRRQLGDLDTSSPVEIGESTAGQFVVHGVPLPKDEFHGIFGITTRPTVGPEYTIEYETRQALNESHHAVHFRVRFR